MSRTFFLGLFFGCLLLGGARARAESDCYPPCREGFVCHERQCITACNPPCGQGEVCTADRRCVGQTPATATTPAPVPVPSAPATTTTPGGVPIVEQGATPQPVPIASSGAAPAVYGSGGWSPPPAQHAMPPPEPEVYDNNFAMHVNVLGFLFFGPVISLEFGGQLAGNVRVRFPNAGFISAFQAYEYDATTGADEELSFGLAFGGGLRYYIGNRGNLRGFFLGAAFEIEHRSFSYNWDARRETQRTDLRANVLANIGYRFPWRGFLMSLGGEFGFASDTYGDESAVLGMLVAELGFHL